MLQTGDRDLSPNLCKFHESNIDATFNFTPLSENKPDYEIKHDNTNETIQLQLCKPLKKPCNGSLGHGACLKSGNKEISLGRLPNLIREDGRIIFEYIGDECKYNNNNSYKLKVVMLCDYEDYVQYPELFPYVSIR